MARSIPPAIVRDFNQTDRDVEVLATPTDRVSFNRGLGDSGYRAQLVEHDCPACNIGLMTRRWEVNPELPDEARYWCMNPNCKHYLGDQMSYAFPGSQLAQEPTIWGDD